MGNKLVTIPDEALALKHSHGFCEDFQYIVTGDLWTITASNSGGAAVGDTVAGILTVSPSDGTVTNNDETYVHQTKETFKLVAGKPLRWAAYTQFTEANTDDANIIVGLKDAWAADSILDDGAGPAASYSGMVFFKVDGSNTWQCEISIAGTQQTKTLTADVSLDGNAKTAGGASYQLLEGAFTPTGGGLGDFDFWIDGVHVARFKDVTITSATDMEFGFGSKNGADSGHELLLVDYCWCYQTR